MIKPKRTLAPVRIRIHYRDQHSGPWTNAIREVHQIPLMGEYIAPETMKVFRVVLTLHILFDADYVAEVFAEVVDFSKVQKRNARRGSVARIMCGFTTYQCSHSPMPSDNTYPHSE